MTTFTPNSFFYRRRHVVRTQTIPHQLRMLRETGRYDAFDLKWKDIYGEIDPVAGNPTLKHLFWDSDLAKWVEGVCYFLESGGSQKRGDEGDHRDWEAMVGKAIEGIVTRFEKAQMADGYLNLHYQVVEKGKRWTNLRDMHELYVLRSFPPDIPFHPHSNVSCPRNAFLYADNGPNVDRYNCGHLLEAALIHSRTYNSPRFLNVLQRYINLLKDNFGTEEGRLHGYPGHPEIELALIRMYRETGDKEVLELARYFIEERGKDLGDGKGNFYDQEAKRRGDRVNERPGAWPTRRAYW